MALSGIGDRVEGLHAVRAAGRAGRVRELLVESGVRNRPDVAEVLQTVTEAGGRVRIVDDLTDLAETTAPQGLLARAVPIPTVRLDDLVERSSPPAVMVLDHLEDPRNVGAIARSALAAWMSGLVISSRRAAPLSAVAFKAAAGALEHLPVAVVSSVADSVERLRRRGLWTVGLSADGESSVFGLGLFAEPVALVVGAEGRGLSRLVSERADVLVRVPMNEAAEHLNASVAAAIAMFEIARVRRGF
jgi:23S rRNA (guanosine2251-2'-O)-methyltransferase